MKHFDVVTIGAATQDTYLSSSAFHVLRNSRASSGKIESFAFGGKIPLGQYSSETGGGATNAAATFKRLGCTVSVLSVCGDDPAGVFVRKELRKEHIDTSHIHVVKKGKTTTSLIFLAKNGERTILVYRGVSRHFKKLQKNIKTLSADWMYVSSLGGDLQTMSVIATRAKKGISLAWNPGASELRAGLKKLKPLLSASSVVLLNWEEALQLFSEKTESGLHQAAQKHLIPILIVTKGETGSVTFVGKKKYVVHIKKVKARDTTGAGDSFGSAFVAGLFTHPGDFKYALTLASANSMANVLVPGAKHGLLNSQHFSKFKSRIKVIGL